MVLAVNMIHGHGLSNKICPWLLPKKTQVKAIVAVNNKNFKKEVGIDYINLFYKK